MKKMFLPQDPERP